MTASAKITGEILAVDDTPANLQLLTSILSQAGHKVRPTKSPKLAIKAALARLPDLILLDIKMPEMDGFEVCRRLKEIPQTSEIPIIFVSAVKNTEDQVKGFSQGAVDFITKPYQEAEILARIQTHMELQSMRRHLEKRIAQRTSELQKAYEAVQQSQARYKGLFDQALDMIQILDTDCRILDANPIELKTLGYSKEEYIGKPLMDIIHPDYREKTGQVYQDVCSGNTAAPFETVLVSKSGDLVNVEVNATPEMENGKTVSILAILRNITRRKAEMKKKRELESLLRQTQRLEAMGALAGGIAHDFNNILSPILGYAEMTRDQMEPGSSMWKNQQAIFDAGFRAKELVQQILSFSRQDENECQPVLIHLVIKEALDLVNATFPSTITINRRIEVVDNPVFADPTQVHQVAMNLFTNAFHAMQETGGIMEVSLAKSLVGEAHPAVTKAGLAAGPYALLTVSDTGHGMDKNTIQHIFEPYFTTKKKGKGTGLGLAMVHGIIQSHDGYISVESTPGEGTRFSVYLPLQVSDMASAPDRDNRPNAHGSEKILVVDDDKVIAELAKKMLKSLGYQVEATTSSSVAMARLVCHPDKFDLLITDLTMPKITGVELAKTLLNIRPGLPIILSTGYSDSIDETKALALGFKKLITKPFIKPELAKAVRQVLDALPD